MNGNWVSVGGTVNTANDTITFQTSSFSPFVLAEIPEPSSLVIASIGLLSLAVCGGVTAEVAPTTRCRCCAATRGCGPAIDDLLSLWDPDKQIV